MAKLGKLVGEGNFSVGDKVLVGTTQEPGTIKFIGPTKFSAGEWVGVELEKALGKNDGTVKDVKYFDCPPSHGLFVRKTALLAVKQAEAVTTKDTKAPKAAPKTKGAAALMKGLKSGEVSKIVDKMEEAEAESPGAPESAASSPASRAPSASAPKAARARAAAATAASAAPTSPASPASPSSASSPAATTKARERAASMTRAPSGSNLDPEQAVALTEMRIAAEDRNVDGLRRSIQTALAVGVAADEVAAAQRILSFESQKVLCREIDTVRGVVAGLAETVRMTQARALEKSREAEKGDWVAGLVRRIEQRVWESLELKVEEKIQAAVRTVARDMLASSRSPMSAPAAEDQAATRIQSAHRGKALRQQIGRQSSSAAKLQGAWRRKMARQNCGSLDFSSAVFVARRRHQAWVSIFDDCCENGSSLDASQFHSALVEVHPRLTAGQTSILFKGYNDGTGQPLVDLSGFCGIAEAVARGDHEACEWADVNVGTFQSLAANGATEAATRIQSRTRGMSARSEVQRRQRGTAEESGETYDFVVVGAGSSGAIVATRLSEDPKVRVCLLEAGGEPPPAANIPAACASLQHNPEADWEYTGDGGKGQCLGLNPAGRMHAPRGKCLGGSSSINYCAFVRGHPGDFDEWARKGAPGWGFADVLPFFKKLETFNDPKHVKSGGVVVDAEAHGKAGPLNVSIRNPIQKATEVFLEACKAEGLPLIDYNGTTRGGAQGGASHTHFSTKNGMRQSSYTAFLQPVMKRPNLKVLTGALATEIKFDGLRAVGVEYQLDGKDNFVRASKELVISSGAYDTPALLLRSGIGPKAELHDVGITNCLLDQPHVGKHMKDHLMATFIHPAPGLGKSVLEVFTSLGPDALKSIGALPDDDASMAAEQKALKADAEKQITELVTQGKGLAGSSLYDAVAFYNTGLGDEHTHDAQLAFLPCGYNKEIWGGLFSYDINKYFGSPEAADELMGPTSQNVMIIAHIVRPRSEGEVRLGPREGKNDLRKCDIHFNYLSDAEGHDMKVFKSVCQRALAIGKSMPGVGPVYIPQVLRKEHNYKDGDKITDALLEHYVKHFPLTVYHATSTCRMGDVLDSQLRVRGIENLRVADASAMPDIISGNTNAPCLMIGERAAELIAREHNVGLKEFVDAYDFVVVGAGSAGAIIATRLSEDPKVRICLLEAGGEPPPAANIPAACASLQHNPAADWEYTGDGGKGQCLGLNPPGRMHAPRGKCLGGSSSINYCAFVRGHPGDFDEWAKSGAPGWSFADVLPYFKKLETFNEPTHVKGEVVIDAAAHGKTGPLGVSIRNPIQKATDVFLDACKAQGLPLIDYNGTTRGGPQGGASHTHFSMKNGMRQSSYTAFLAPVMERPNLTVLTGAYASKIKFISGAAMSKDSLRAVGVEYQLESGEAKFAEARKEVVISNGAFNTPALLLRSGIGPKEELKSVGVPCVLDQPHVGKHMKDHLMAIFIHPAPGLGKSVLEVFTSLGPDALKSIGALPADDASMAEEQKALKAEAEKQITELLTEGRGLAGSSLYDAVAFYNTGLGDEHTHDVQLAFLPCGYNKEIWGGLFSYDIEKYFGSPEAADELMGPTSQNVMIIAHIVRPHSEGEVRLSSADATAQADIRFNYLSDPKGHDAKVFKSVCQRALEIGKAMPGVGPVFMPKVLQTKHKYKEGDEITDAILEDYVKHFPLTVYHATSTCRMGDVLDPELRVKGVSGPVLSLRVADASAMPNIISGNTNAPCLMIGEKAAEIIACAHQVALKEFVGGKSNSSSQADKRKRDEAAVKIQSVQRGKASRASQQVQDEAAVKIQRWFRRLLAGKEACPFATNVKRLQLRHADWCSAFDEHANGNAGIDEATFQQAFEAIMPGRLSAAQRRVMYQGYLDGTGKDQVDLEGFVTIAQAVSEGDLHAAELADVNLKLFLTLGSSEADEAASKIGTAVRARSRRVT